MSLSYFNESHKTMKSTSCDSRFWSLDTIHEIENTLYQRGYDTVMCNLRMDHNGVLHNSLIVERDDVPVFLERFFQCRIMVECMATGKHRAEIIFVCDTPGVTMLKAVRGIRRVKV